MRGLRGTSLAAVGVCALLAAGGGYALASGSGGNTITVCVSHHGGALYKAKKCAKHDKKLTWNKLGPRGPQGIQGIQGQTGNTGPQGPGATSINHDWSSAASPARESLGTVGPWTLTGLCTQSGTDTTIEVDYTGPGFQVSGMVINPIATQAFSGSVAGPLTNVNEGKFGPTTGQFVSTATDLFVPTSGSPVQALLTEAANGASGSPANSCHFSAVVTPAAAAATSGAAERTRFPMSGSASTAFGPLGR